MLRQEEAIVFIRHCVVGLTCALALFALSATAGSSYTQDSTPAKTEEPAQPPAEKKAKEAAPADETAEKDAAADKEGKELAPESAAENGGKASDDAAHEKPTGEPHKDGETKEGQAEHEGKTEHGGGDKAGHDATGKDDAGHGDAGHEDHEGEGHEGEAHVADPGHGNATAVLTKAEEVRSDLAIYSLVVFLLLLAILFRFAWGPIVEGLDKREAAVATNIQHAADNAAKSEELVREHEARLADAAEETKKIIDKAKADAERTAQRIVEEAETAAARQRERAIADIENAKTTALAEVSEKSVDIALGLAGEIVSKNLDRDQHAELIRVALEQFPSQN